MIERRVGIYARVSHADDQDPAAQLAALGAYAAAQPAWTVVAEYVDRAPATGAERPAWAALRADVARQRINLVLVWKLDRAYRSALHALAGVEWLTRHRTAFVCATQPIDTSTAHGRLTFTILAAVAEMERELISERTRAGLARARELGIHIGRPKGAKDRRKRKSRRPVGLPLAAWAEDLPL